MLLHIQEMEHFSFSLFPIRKILILVQMLLISVFSIMLKKQIVCWEELFSSFLHFHHSFHSPSGISIELAKIIVIELAVERASRHKKRRQTLDFSKASAFSYGVDIHIFGKISPVLVKQ